MQEMVDAVSALIIGPVKQVPVRPHVFPGCSFQDTQLFFLHQAFRPYHEPEFSFGLGTPNLLCGSAMLGDSCGVFATALPRCYSPKTIYTASM